MGNYTDKLFRNYSKTHINYLDTDEEEKLKWFKSYIARNYLPHINKRNKNSLILEIGCNKGYILKVLAEHNFDKLIGIDLSPDDISYAKKLNPDVSIECNDALTFLENKKERFDIIILKAVLEHINKEDVMPLLQKINLSLTRGGIVIIDVPNMDWFFASHERYMDYTHQIGFTRESLAQIMRNFFVNVSIFRGKIATDFSIISYMKLSLRPFFIFIFNVIFKILGEGLSDVWWENRSIIGIGYKRF